MQEVLIRLGLKTNLCMADKSFTTKDGVVNLRFTEATYWATYINENYFDSYGFRHRNF